MELNNLKIEKNSNLKQALAQIEKNHQGIVFVVNEDDQVIATATDGDIRRALLEGETLESSIMKCTNESFVWCDENTPRELLLKQLDHVIRVIPILNQDKKLISVVSRSHLPMQSEEKIYARAVSPVRVSFGGGGSDLTHYFADHNGAVINMTVSLYSHAVLKKRSDSKILIYSKDLDAKLEANSLHDALSCEGKFGLIQSILKTIHPDFGFELYIHSDFPVRSGLGGSAVVSSAILGCFNQFRQDKWDLYEIAELAFQAERLYLGVAGGWQDQYATVFGGLNFMEFRMDQNIVSPLRINEDILKELEESLVLCNTGTIHDSGDIHKDQKSEMQAEDIKKKVQANVDITYEIRNHLLRGRLLDFGKALNQAWLLKRQFSSKISSPKLDEIYEAAISHGAVGGKLLGAGGGGFFLFYVPPFKKIQLMVELERKGLEVCPFRFERNGLQAWSSREKKNSPT